jgi:hypothetical protein
LTKARLKLEVIKHDKVGEAGQLFPEHNAYNADLVTHTFNITSSLPNGSQHPPYFPKSCHHLSVPKSPRVDSIYTP